MILSIVQYPDPILKKKAAPVERVDRDVQQLIEDMFETMYAAPGVGLAAPQVGISKRILVVDVGRLEGVDSEGKAKRRPNPQTIVNPTFKSREGKIVWEEGCLSLPQLIVPMERSKKVVIEGLDREGNPITLLGEDLLAVAFQHEIDHLDGVLLTDRISRLKRDLYKKKLEKMEPIEHSSGPAYMG